jgi:hypothetical protein
MQKKTEQNNQIKMLNANNELHFFRPYKSWSDLGKHIHAHIMVILPLSFVVIFPIISLLLPVAWFTLFMRNRPEDADRIMTNLVATLTQDLLQLVTVPFRCLSTIFLGVAVNGTDNTIKTIETQLKAIGADDSLLNKKR